MRRKYRHLLRRLLHQLHHRLYQRLGGMRPHRRVLPLHVLQWGLPRLRRRVRFQLRLEQLRLALQLGLPGTCERAPSLQRDLMRSLLQPRLQLLRVEHDLHCELRYFVRVFMHQLQRERPCVQQRVLRCPATATAPPRLHLHQ